jgi:hypothetical protein
MGDIEQQVKGVTLTISLDPAGKVTVNYPQNKMLCVFMLHEAQVMIDDWFKPQIALPGAAVNGKGLL